MKKSLLVFASLMLISVVSFAQVDVTASGGTPYASYTTLKLAFDAINLGTQTGTISIAISGNTTETASAVLNASGSGSASYTTISIQPSGGAARTITGVITGHLIDLNGADNVTIDGLNTGGNSLTISNTATGASSAIRFIADATNNIIQNCSISGSASTASNGVINFSTGTSSGNDGNNINNCNIGPAGANLPINAIYSSGTSGVIDNSGNTINQNNISDYFSAASVSTGINLASTGNSGWTITNNKLFQTALRLYTTASTHNGIYVGVGSGYTISGNTIGFANSSGTGFTMMVGNSVALSGTFPSAWNNTGTANATRYIAINCAFTAAGTVSNIQGNTISGFACYTSSGASTANGIWCAINVTSGNVNIGTSTGNTIGATSGQGSVYTACNAAGGAAVGIYVNSANNVSIQNNTIGAIDAAGAVVASGCGGITGIDVAGAGTFTISNNTIGNATVNNLRAGNLATGTTLSNTGTFVTTSGVGAVVGIRSAATGGPLNINSNTLRGFAMSSTSSSASSTFTGITNTGTATSAININGNFLGTSGVGLVNYLFAIGANSALTGINCSAGTITAPLSISNNDIQGITNSVAGANSHIYISWNHGPSGVTDNINNNTFTNLNVNTTGSVTFLNRGTTSFTSTGIENCNNNSIVTGFNKVSAGGTVTFFTNGAGGSSPAGAVQNETNNNFSNITLTGATAVLCWSNADGGAPTKNITNNTFNNITTGAAQITGISWNYSGDGTNISSNTLSNFTGGGVILSLASGTSNSGTHTVSLNTLTNFTALGAINVIQIGAQTSSTTNNITNNTIRAISTSGAANAVYGIICTGGLAANVTNISRNRIGDITSNFAGASTVNGILVQTLGTYNIFNNLIGDLKTPTSTSLNAIQGINVGASVTVNAYYNSIYLNASSTSVTTFGSSCIGFSSTATAFNSRNNILYNASIPAQEGSNVATNGISAGLRRTTGTGGTVPSNYSTTSNNNAYWVNPSAGTNNHLAYVEGTTTVTNPMNTFSNLKTFMGSRDQASFQENVTWQNTTASNADFLKYNTGLASQLESGAVNIASYTTDYTGTIRQGNGGYLGTGTAPDVGAWELEGLGLDLTAPAISSVTLVGNACDLTSRNITSTIADGTGVDNSASLKPRIYYRKNAGTYYTSQGVLTSGNINSGSWTFTITYADFGGVVASDVIDYFIVAQDVAGTPNVGGNPSAGLVLTDVNTITTPPTTPNTYTINSTLSGTYNVGSGEAAPFNTLTAAVNKYNSSCLSGPVTFILTDATYSGSETFPIVINANVDASATNTFTIKPALGVSPTITGSSASSGIIKIYGADYLTIDGSNSGGTSQDLTIINTSTTSSAVIWIGATATDGATNNVIKNCNLAGGGYSSTAAVYGIYSGSGVTMGNIAAVANSNNTVQNNIFTKEQNGMYIYGYATTPYDQNWNISGNTFGSKNSSEYLSYRGLYLSNASNFTISYNTVTGVVSTATSTSSMLGIQFGASIATGNVFNNNINNLKQNGTTAGGYGANGIYIGATTTTSGLSVYNNTLSDISAYGTTGYITATGINISAGGGYKIYYNSVSLATPQTVLTAVSTPVYVSASITTASSLDIRNNIFSNTTVVAPAYMYAFYSAAANTVYQYINYNDYYTTGTYLGYISTNRTDLTNWKIGTTQDANSINVLPVFASTTDLHLITSSNIGLNDFGTYIAVVTTDIDGITRSITTPDMGADEFTPPTDAVDWANLQYITKPNMQPCETGNWVYAQAYEPGVTDAVGQGAGITAWIGKNTTNTDPSTWAPAAWTLATYNVDAGNNDEYKLDYGPLAAGTYYIASRFQLNGGPYKYGATNNGFWDGTTYTNGVITVAMPAITASASPVSVCNGEASALSVSSSNSNYTYVWNPGSLSGATQSVTPASTTVYTVTATDGVTGCTTTATATVTVKPTPSALTVTPATASIAPGDIQSLVATGGTIADLTVLSENFNSSAPGWTVESGGSSPVACNWYYQSVPYTDASGSATFSNFTTLDGGKFAYSNSDAGGSGSTSDSRLISPVFSTAGMSSASLTFEHVFKTWSSDATVAIEISTDGGATWPTVLKSYKGSSVGTVTNNAQATANENISLASYLNQPNLRFRFNYISAWGYFWIVDNIKVSGSGTASTTWSPTTELYTDAGATVAYTGTAATTVYAKPSVSRTYTATATAASGCTSSNTSAITVSYSGATWLGTLSTDWATPGNWNPTTVPDASTNAIIPSVTNLPVVNEDPATPAQCLNLTINSAASVTVEPNKALTVSGTIINSAGNTGLVVKSDATGTGSLITSSAVNATVERYLTPSVWHLISSPVSGQSIPTLVGASPFATNGIKYGLAPYDNSLATPNWVHYTTGTLAGAGDFVTAKGYEAMLTSGSALAFKGTLVTSDQNYSVTANTNNWNVIGNPYSSAINGANVANDFLSTNSGIFQTGFTALYVWDASTGLYNIVNFLSGATYIPVGQAFFINAADGGATASFTTAMRTHSTASFSKSGQTVYPKIDLKAAIANNNRSTQVYFVPGSSAGVDEGYDAGMLNAANTDMAVYTAIEGNKIDLALQCLPDNNYENLVIPVGLNAPQGSVVEFTADITNLPGETKVYLEDRLNGTFTQLDASGSYKLTLAAASSGTGRFYLHTSKLLVGNDPLAENVYTIIPQPQHRKILVLGKIVPSSPAMLYDMSGRLIGTSILSNSMENEIPFNPTANGIYLLKIKSGGSIINRKINWVK